MIGTPTRRAVLGAGAFVAGSLFGIEQARQAPLPPTPACHDGMGNAAADRGPVLQAVLAGAG